MCAKQEETIIDFMPDSNKSFQIDTSTSAILSRHRFQLLSDLAHVELSYEKSANTGLKQIIHLGLSNNKIDTLDRGLFDELTRFADDLDTFSLGLKDLNTIPLLPLDSTTYSILGKKLVYVFRRLQSLNLSQNRIYCIDVNALSVLNNLTRLNLASNQIASIRGFLFNGLGNLVELDLSHNRLESIERNSFYGLERLEQLRLNSNRIGRVEPRAFYGLGKLKQLWLYENIIQEIDSIRLDGLSRLELLQLDFNRLSSIEIDVFKSLSALKDLDLSNNRITLIRGLKNAI